MQRHAMISTPDFHIKKKKKNSTPAFTIVNRNISISFLNPAATNDGAV